MCGIAGIFHFDPRNPVQQELIVKMTDAMAHRGPDASGIFTEGNIGLGHRRLSIIDLSTSANQPFSDRTGRFHLVFNGELYNFHDVKASMKDVDFRTSSDTEVLVEAWAAKAIDALGSIKGMFAFAVWDRDLRELHLVRDRMGVKPLYYFNNKDVFVFASEIRAILATGLVRRKLDKNALSSFLMYQSVSWPQSIIEGIEELPAGCCLKVSEKGIDIIKYWDITKLHAVHDDVATVRTRISDLLSKAVEQRLIGDVPIGAFLSGGIDSSAVVGLMARVSNSPPLTFNIGFEEQEFDESSYAGEIAKKFQTHHERILLRPSIMLEELNNALDAMDTPSGDGINSYVVSKAVKKAGLTVALSGIGGDELFAGYPFFSRYKQLRQLNGIWPLTAPMRKLMAEFAGRSKWREILKASDLNVETVYPILRQVMQPKLVQDLVRFEVQQDPVEHLLQESSGAISKFPILSQVSIAEFMNYTRQTLLKDTDQMSMGVSLEVREPFFDHELVEYVLGIPDSIKDPVYPKKLLVESLGKLLPDSIIHRKKQGFTFPWALWIRKDLNEFATGKLNKLCERDFINADSVKAKWRQFLKGDDQVAWMEIWLLVILEYWLEKNAVE